MNFAEISEEAKVFPGEYLLHSPTNQVVLCGAFNRKENFIRAFGNGKYLEDSIDKFKKIQISSQEQKAIRKTKTCGGCKGRG